ncbi:MAG: FtsX-like permease family protein [Anaeroplasmataceae bacterium]|nr:FtsX-like permease family protein [Anaeroplasmataceae bacterium]MDE6415212.1 FtsX-like permease family protein [Anaeroplasmataceae bacterium]
MRNVLNIKVVREIKNNFKTYLSVILIATLAVTLFTGIFANYKNFNDRLDYIYQEANMCDGIIMTNTYNEEIEDDLKEKNATYEKRLYVLATTGNVDLYLASFTKDSKMNLPFKTSLEESVSSTMVLVDEKFLTRTNKEIGDTFHVDIPLANFTMNLDFLISGTMTHPESLENSTYNPSFVYVGYDALLEAISNKYSFPKEVIEGLIGNYYNQFLVQAEESLFTEVKEKYMEDENFIYSLKRSELPSNMTVDADVEQAKQLIYIFPVIFYLVAVLIILTSISQLINREGKNIGIMKALGFSKAEILFHYMKIFIVLSVIGSILGIILGPIIVPNVMGNKYNILYQLPKISLPFFRWEYLISVAILIVITALTSIFACYGAMNQVPASCLRGDNAVPMKLSILNHLSFIKKIPLPILMAFRNMKRKWSRTIMVIIGVLGCSALLACGFGIEDTINYGLDLELNELIPYDVSVTYSTYTEKEEAFSSLEHVKHVDEYGKYPINVESKNLVSSYLFLLPEEAHILQIEYQKDSCIISRRISEEIGAKVGDELRFVYYGNKYSFVVTEVVDFCISQGVFLSKSSVSEEEFHPNQAWIKTEDEMYNASVAAAIAEMDGISSTQTIKSMRAHADEVIGSIKVMTWTIKIFAILLAVVVLYNLALLNFKERIKDIATLKVLGFSKFEVASSFMIEIIFLTFVGALVGLTLGYPLLVAVLSINENPLISYIYHIHLLSYFFTILITCGSSLLINLFFAFLTNRVEMVESLKSVE